MTNNSVNVEIASSGYTCFAHPKGVPCWTRTAYIVGALVIVGGLFYLLAANQILPQGINLISQLGVGGHIYGYGMMGLGVVLVALVCARTWLIQERGHE